MKKKKIILIAVSLAILAGGGVWLFGGSTAKHKVTYATAVSYTHLTLPTIYSV